MVTDMGAQIKGCILMGQYDEICILEANPKL